MPTLVRVDSFQHRVLRVNNTGTDAAWYRLVTDTGTTAPSHGGGNITFDTGVVRTAEHACSLKIAYLAARGIQVRGTVPTGIRDMNVSFYFRTVDGTNPANNNIQLFTFGNVSTNGVIEFNTSGQVTARVVGSTKQAGAVDVCDGAWHRIDARYQTSTTTGLLDVQVDGTALTQATGTIAAADMDSWNFGVTSLTADYTVYYSDLVISATGADYPMGDHICKMLEINGTGTHNKGAGAFADQAGGTTDAALLAAVDDAWDGTTPELSQTGEDYVEQATNDGAGYVEFTFEDPSESTIWGAGFGFLMAAEDSATANNGTCFLVDSGGTTLVTSGSIDPSGSATVYNGNRYIASAPGAGWSGTTLSGVKVRFGFSTDAAPDVLFNSAIVEYAAPWTAPSGQTANYAVAAETDSALTFTHEKLAGYGIASETDAALALLASKLVQYGIALETDSALVFTGALGGGAQTAQYGIALETDTAIAFVHSKLAQYGIAGETSTALAFLADRRHEYGVAAETATALAFTVSKLASYGTATETDAALALLASKLVQYGIALETDSGLAFTAALGGGQTALYGLAVENDAALALLAEKLAQYGIAVEADTALPFTGTGALPITVTYDVAAETDEALSFEASTARILEGFEVAYGEMEYGRNRKRRRYATGQGRAWR